MARLRTPTLLALFLLCASLPACRKFPEVDVSEAQFDAKTPYPEFVPLDVLLKEPEASITDDVENELTARREDLQATPAGQDAQAAQDPFLDRIDALRAKSTAKNASDPVIDDTLRKRMESGITAPAVPE